jgi:hypothetical protein
MNTSADLDVNAIAGPPAFEIIQQDGLTIGTDGTRQVVLLDATAGARMFKRRAIRNLMGAHPERIEWCVTELNGVKVYVSGNSVVITTRDLQP